MQPLWYLLSSTAFICKLYCQHEKVEYQLYFLLGRGPNLETLPSDERQHHQEILTGIIKEAKQHNDMVVGDFPDTYENLPIKTNLGYQFFYDYCEDHKERCFVFQSIKGN